MVECRKHQVHAIRGRLGVLEPRQHLWRDVTPIWGIDQDSVAATHGEEACVAGEDDRLVRISEDSRSDVLSAACAARSAGPKVDPLPAAPFGIWRHDRQGTVDDAHSQTSAALVAPCHLLYRIVCLTHMRIESKRGKGLPRKHGLFAHVRNRRVILIHDGEYDTDSITQAPWIAGFEVDRLRAAPLDCRGDRLSDRAWVRGRMPSDRQRPRDSTECHRRDDQDHRRARPA